MKLIILILFILIAGIVDFIIDQLNLRLIIAEFVYEFCKILVAIVVVYIFLPKKKIHI